MRWTKKIVINKASKQTSLSDPLTELPSALSTSERTAHSFILQNWFSTSWCQRLAVHCRSAMKRSAQSLLFGVSHSAGGDKQGNEPLRNYCDMSLDHAAHGWVFETQYLCIFSRYQFCGRGGIGRRTRLRIWRFIHAGSSPVARTKKIQPGP